jgi:hypothetical protein
LPVLPVRPALFYDVGLGWDRMLVFDQLGMIIFEQGDVHGATPSREPQDSLKRG